MPPQQPCRGGTRKGGHTGHPDPKGIIMLDQNKFDGLAFPVATVRYGNNNKWFATIRRDDDTFRARVPYDHAVGGGARGALAAAVAAFETLQADLSTFADGSYLAVPGDLDSNTYTFTFVPAHFFG